jgi:hypothetical protein
MAFGLIEEDKHWMEEMTADGSDEILMRSRIVNLALSRLLERLPPGAVRSWISKLTLKHCISSNAYNSGFLAYSFMTEVTSNGNLQIKMHFVTSQDLSQR